MENKLGITKGKYIEQGYRSYSGSVSVRVVRDGFDDTAEDVLTITGLQRTKNEIEGTLKVVLDALNTAKEFDKLASELLKQNSEMLEMLSYLISNCKINDRDAIVDIKQLISKITE